MTLHPVACSAFAALLLLCAACTERTVASSQAPASGDPEPVTHSGSSAHRDAPATSEKPATVVLDSDTAGSRQQKKSAR